VEVEEVINKLIKYLIQLFSAVLFSGCVPTQWKVAQIILIMKLGKPPNDLTSYQPISFLPIASKILENLLLKLVSVAEDNGFIPDHQFGFRKRHSTREQMHLIVQWIIETLENKQYCSAAFLDMSQVFDKIWHVRLLYKLRPFLSLNYFILLKSHLYSTFS
jgi:hypothetical protein